MPKEEQVLVFERKILEQIGIFHGLKFNVADDLRKLFSPGVLRFMPRPQAEADPNYKQLIPYVIMACGGKYLSYVRGKRAGETRLVGNRSIGIGGHINPVDEVPLFDTDFREAYPTAVEREVAEEVTVQANHTDRVVALLNDDSNEVGRVHLGIVHYWTLDSAQVSKREQMITQMAFMSLEELQQQRDTLETWSSLCLDGLKEMSKSAASAIHLDALFDQEESMKKDFCRSGKDADAKRVDAQWGSLTWLASDEIGNCSTMTLGRVIIKKGMSNPRHAHNNCDELLYLLKGKLEHTAGDESVIMEAGDTLVAKAGVMHNALNVGDVDADMIVAYSSATRDFQKENHE